MLTVDPQKCSLCGECIRVCHDYCIFKRNGRIEIDESLCDMIGMPGRYRVLCIVLLGYSAVKYANKIEGLKPAVRFAAASKKS